MIRAPTLTPAPPSRDVSVARDGALPSALRSGAVGRRQVLAGDDLVSRVDARDRQNRLDRPRVADVVRSDLGERLAHGEDVAGIAYGLTDDGSCFDDDDDDPGVGVPA